MAYYLHPSWPLKKTLDLSHNHGRTVVTLPARFDFIGGWNDTPPYFFSYPAAVVESALTLAPFGQIAPTTPAIRVTVEAADKFTTIENGEVLNDLDGHIVLAKTLEFLGLSEPPLKLEISNTIPKGSGLGGSGLLVAAIYAAIVGFYEGIDLSAAKIREIIDAVLVIEQYMESGGGWQDDMGGLLPSMKLVQTEPGDEYHYRQEYSDVSLAKLSELSLVVNSNQPRKASFILYSIREKCVNEEERALKLMELIRQNAIAGFECLKNGDIKNFARLFGESWQEVNKVETESSIELVDKIIALCDDNLWGYKIGGAGGGGFILLTFADVASKERAAAKIQQFLAKSQLLQPTFGGPGLTVEQGDRRLTAEQYPQL